LQPALLGGLGIWPLDQDAAPPLAAALYQIEHREVALNPVIPVRLRKRVAELVGVTKKERAVAPDLLAGLGELPLSQAQRQLLGKSVLANDRSTLFRLLARAKSAWTPILPEENWVLGDRDEKPRDTEVHPGVELLTLFPEIPRRGAGAGLDVFWRDVYDLAEGSNEVVRPVPSSGIFHQYRVRAIDPIGRPSPTWALTDVLRLEKHIPPPVPVGPDEKLGDLLDLPGPTGVQARVLVRDAPDLTEEDIALLGADNNVIVLRWGWHEQQREQDPFAREFRVYFAGRALDRVAGTLTAVAVLSPGVYSVTLHLDRAVSENAARGTTLPAGYPFYIRDRTAGSLITATVETRVPTADGSLREPATRPVELALPLTPQLTRPPAWSERVKVQPITAEVAYQAVLRNRLTLTLANPHDALWVSVSAADDQGYVPDQLAPVQTRPKNESAIIPILSGARQ
jgi:hypothetical protein